MNVDPNAKYGSNNGGGNNDFTPIPPGVYFAQIIGFKAGKSYKGTPLLNIRYRIVDGGKYEKRQIWDNLYLTDRSIARAQNLIISIGVTHVVDLDDEKMTWDAIGDKILGIELRIEKGTDGKERNSIIRFHKLTSAEMRIAMNKADLLGEPTCDGRDHDINANNAEKEKQDQNKDDDMPF